MFPYKPQEESAEKAAPEKQTELPPDKRVPRSILTFRSSATGDERLAPHWQIGIDKQRVAFYVGLALLAGFAFGYASLRFTNKPTETKVAQPDANPPSVRLTPREPALAVPAEFRHVNRVLKADTIEVEGVGNIRLIGVEVPEANSQNEAYAVQARNALNFTEKSLTGQDVKLEFDPAFAAKDHKDISGNTLAYVYTQNGLLINAELLKQGYAFVRSSEMFKMAEDFRSYEREAMTTMRGLWGDHASASTTAAPTPPAVVPAPMTSSPGAEATPKRPKLSPLSPNDIGPNLPGVVGGTPAAPAQPSATSPAGPMVIATADRIYHKQGCELAIGKKTTMSLSQARAAGYMACSRCFPSTSIKMQ